MENIGIDLHKRESQLCIITDGGGVVESRIRTERGRFAEVLRCSDLPCAGQRASQAARNPALHAHSTSPAARAGSATTPIPSR